MHPSIEIVEADPKADRRLLESLADWCDRYTPLVALDGDDGLLLDITGCAHLFGGEGALLDDLRLRLHHQGFDARAGLASTPGMAWAAARFLSPALVEPGAERHTLSPLPLPALRLEAAVRTSLEGVGLRNVGAVLAAPRAPLARRFGKGLLLRLDQVLGSVEEAISPRLPVPPLSVERYLPEPIGTTEAVEELVEMMAAGLKVELERRNEGARSLQLALFRVDGQVARYRVGTSRPMRSPQLIRRLLRERLTGGSKEFDAGYGFELVRLSVLDAVPFEAEQGDLSGEGSRCDADLALLADRVSARLGDTALLRPVPRESHLPECAITMTVFAETRHWDAAIPEKMRPVRLLNHPEPIEVTATEVPEGPPLNFRWRRLMHRVARSEGPERIAPEWWREADQMPTRDYFRVEDEEGHRYWLYRQGLYGAGAPMPRWFMHGFFA